MATGYSIVSQAPDFEVNPAGTGFQNVWKITYKVSNGPAKGTVGTVTVPEDNHNAAAVSSLIEAKVKDLNEIASLGG